MTNVFMQCKRRFNNIVTRDETLLKTHRKQRRIQDYFTARGDDENKIFRHPGDSGGPGSSAHAADNDFPTTTAAISSVTPFVGHADGEIAIHRTAIPEAPAELRLRAKRGDSDVRICE